jgi:hypothetical protein
MNSNDPSGHLPNILVGAIVGAVVGGGYSIVSQLTVKGEIDFSELAAATGVGAVAGAVAGATFGVSLAIGGAIAAEATGAAASAIGAGSVIVGGVAAGQASRATENVLKKGVDHAGDGLWDPADMVRDAVLAPIMFKATGGAFREIAPVSLYSAGPYATKGIPATGIKSTAAQRAALNDSAGRCHQCGQLLEPGQGIADHIPPSSISNGAPQILFRQCNNCMGQQAKSLRWPDYYDKYYRYQGDFFRPWRTYFDLRDHEDHE